MDDREQFLQIHHSLAVSVNKMRNLLNKKKIPILLKKEISTMKKEMSQFMVILEEVDANMQARENKI